MPSRAQSLIRSISEALVAYLTYQSKCGLGEAYSEALIYDPILRVARHLDWDVRCEVPVKSKGEKNRGDHSRIDFMLIDRRNRDVAIGLEVKFNKKRFKNNSRDIKIQPDFDKLHAFKKTQEKTRYRRVEPYVLVIGRGPLKKVKKAQKPLSPFTLSLKHKGDIPAISSKQSVELFKTSNTLFVASWVPI